jgi:predicted metal-dependent enzyme (double-stranded beta helix superfamily)
MAVEAQRETALDRFVTKVRDLFAEEPDPEQRWPQLIPIMAELLADPTVRDASASWPYTNAGPRHPDGRVDNLCFYLDSDYGFALQGLKKAQGRAAGRQGIHDHGRIWTLYGVLDGHERVERYERTDDRSQPDHAEIERTVDLVVGPGEIDLVKPFEIHTEVTVGEATIALILRSEPSGSCMQGRYDPETGAYREGLGPHLVSVDMFPK